MIYEKYRLRKMSQLVNGRHKVLDIGWVDYPNTYLSNPQVVGLDLQIRSLPLNYSECFMGSAMDLPMPFSPNSFDAIIAGEIIEHLERPVDFLRNCKKTLGDGGILVLSTPNPNSFIERLLTINLSQRFFYSHDHITLYPQRWLIRMMGIAGFVDIKLYSGGFPIHGFGTIPFPRPWCYQTIAAGYKPIKIPE
jgi:SAM-dependent methyltransferase